MEEMHNSNRPVHKVTLSNRGKGTISGVHNVISFDPNEILLDTEQGMLMIKGVELNVTKLMLDKGEVDIDGRVDSFTYSETKSRPKNENGLFERLFK